MIARGNVVAGIVRRGAEVLLVLEQGPDESEPHWSIPGGGVDPGETFLEALARELREEAGIVLRRAGALLYANEVQHEALGGGSYLALVFEVAAWEGEVQASGRDAMVREAAFVPVSDAIELLQRRDPAFAFVYEPVIEWLQGRYRETAFYCYRVRGGTVERVFGPA